MLLILQLNNMIKPCTKQGKYYNRDSSARRWKFVIVYAFLVKTS